MYDSVVGLYATKYSKRSVRVYARHSQEDESGRKMPKVSIFGELARTLLLQNKSTGGQTHSSTSCEEDTHCTEKSWELTRLVFLICQLHLGLN